MRTAVLNSIKQSFLLVLGMVVLFTQSGRATPIISNVVETGGDNEATDTVSAKWTGVTFTGGIANEPVPGLAAGASYTVGVFGNHAPTFVDRNHRYTNADPAQLPGYLAGGEYIMNGNDNRDNATMTMDVTVDRGAKVYLLIDNRLGDTDGATPPTFDATHMQWVVDEGWTPVITGVNHLGAAGVPDEVAIDEGADGTINQWYSIYTKTFPAGTFQLKQADNAGQNMYGVVVTRAPAPPALLWTVGLDDNGWPLGDGGGANASFVQENGAINPLPGSPTSTEGPQGADNDYYFAGDYTTVIAGNGAYAPVGAVAVSEEAAERAFAAADNDLRYHFNLPISLNPFDLLSVTFDANNLDDPNAVNTDPRYGIEVYINGVLVQTNIVIRPAQLGTDYTTPPFSLASVNAQTGPGFDNIVSLRGINYNAEGGGNWMGIDYVQLNAVAGTPPVSVGLNFGADEVAPAGSALAPTDVAGAVRQANWNNLNGANGTAANLNSDVQGVATPTSMTVEWASPNTWSSTGRGEENNGFPAGPDKTLMTGYIDTTDTAAGAATVTVSGIPTEFTAGGYDVLVYGLGGVAGRGGAYTIGGETKYGTSPANPTAHVEDPGVNMADTGTYVRFRGLYTSSFTLVASADAAPGAGLVNFRAPVNGIQIVKSGDPKAGLAVGYVVKERYENIGSSVALADLLNNPKYINHTPDYTCLRTDFSANDANECNDCGLVVRGFFIPTVSGPHTFYLSADDGAGLFLSTDELPANKVQIATEPLWAGRRNYIGEADGGGRGDPPTNVSAPITLVAGNHYYIEGAVKEGGGGDNLDVAVQGPGDPAVADGDRPISGNRIGVIVDLTGSSLAITSNPASILVPEGNEASFTVGVAATSPLCGGGTAYQWQRNGVNIPGANSASYTFGPVTPDDHLATFRCVVRIPGITRTSTSATMEVLGTECLRVTSAAGSVDGVHATVQFSAFVNAADPSTTDIFNYSVSGPGGSSLGVTAVALGAGGKSVILTTEPQAENTDYTVVVQNVQSIVGSPVCDAPTNTATFRTFAISCGFALQQLYLNIPGVAVTDLTGNANYPGNPSLQSYVGLLEGPVNTYENYGTRLSGVLIPPVSGAYNFFMSSDDGGAFYLSTDSSPGNAVLICSEPTWNGSRDWVGTARRDPAAPQNRSSTLFPAGIELVAGQHYYFELLGKEGGGGDNTAATWQLPGAPLPANGSSPISGAFMGAPANPLDASLAITQQPVDQTVVLPTATPVAFTVAVSASAQGNTAPPTFYQWYRDNGTGFNPVSGGNSARLEFVPTLADNGARFQAQIYIPGATATSQVARLTVTGGQAPNSPPSFTCSTNIPTVLEGAGAQTVPNAATDILPHSIARTPIQVSYDFSTVPDGVTMINRVLDLPSDVSLIRDGILKLTDAVNGSQGGFLTPALPVVIDSFTVSFKARVGGGTCCGSALPDGSGVTRPADGWSVTIGQVQVPLSFPVAAEEGAAVGAGVVVAFDTWDNNGTDEAPAVDVKAGGSVVAFQSLDGEREGGRPPAGPLVNDPATGLPLSYRTGAGYVNVRVHLDADGTLDVDFKNVRVIDNVQVGVGAFANGRVAFGARTGGANDNQWIDDLSIEAFPLDASSAESGQTVTFTTSNNNPSLFSVQPAVSPNGTLTYTPAPGACGQAIVTLVAKDNGGTANGGNDTSAPCTVVINVTCANACPVAGAQSVISQGGAPVNIVLSATDADGDALTYTVVTGPAHGALSGTAPNLTYTPTAGYIGADSFVFKASDGAAQCNSTATVSIDVRGGGNNPPVARILAKPLYDFRPNITNPVVISCNGSNASLKLNGTRSTDVEGGTLTYAWLLEPGAAPFSTNGLTEVDLDLTEQTIQLAVTDPQGNVGLDSLTVEVITIGEAIDELTDKVKECTLPRAQKRSLIATLKVASALSHRGNDLFWEDDGYEDSCWRLQLAADILWVFEWKVWLHLIHRDPDLALCLMDWADQIICAIDECPCDDGGEDDYDIDYPLDP